MSRSGSEWADTVLESRDSELVYPELPKFYLAQTLKVRSCGEVEKESSLWTRPRPICPVRQPQLPVDRVTTNQRTVVGSSCKTIWRNLSIVSEGSRDGVGLPDGNFPSTNWDLVSVLH